MISKMLANCGMYKKVLDPRFCNVVHGDPVELSPLGTDVSCGRPCKANRFISEFSFEFFGCAPFVFSFMCVDFCTDCVLGFSSFAQFVLSLVFLGPCIFLACVKDMLLVFWLVI